MYPIPVLGPDLVDVRQLDKIVSEAAKAEKPELSLLDSD